ncbi:hypothetical protein DFJ74DRAFT_680230 [Hyaloraphidium curvatum]|nr:hypothetical protein DFJ74DRAFT_680230 [Hyaloraphidium curvatum]
MLGNARSRRRWERGNWTGLDRATVRKCLPQPPTPRRVRHPTVCRALPAMGVPGAVLGILVSLLSSLLSALGMNLQAGQALIEAAATAAASPSSPRSAAWRRLSRSFSRFGDDHWLFGADGEEAPPDRGAEEPHDRAAGGVTPPDPATPPDAATEATPLLSHAAHLPAARPRRIPTVVEQSRALESAPLPPGTVLCKRLLGPWMWHAGLALYLVGTAGGGSLALCFLPPLVLAPLSSASLVFNIGFSRWILGTEIGAHDYVGTVLLLAGSALCGVFASQDNAVTSPATLPVLLSSPLFLAAFSAQAALSLAAFLPLVAWESLRPGGALSRHIWVPWLPPLEEQTGALAYAEEEEGWADAWADKGSGGEGAKGGRRREVWAGMAYAAVGGVVASLSLLLTKSGWAVVGRDRLRTAD